MRILFLDHDSVLCLQKQWGTRFKKPNKYDADLFDRDCVQVVNEILIELPDTEIVISSDWRHNMSLGLMREMYLWQGIIKQPISFTYLVPTTATTLEKCRSEEINHWLNMHNIVEPWCAVDDLNMSEWLGDNFVLCPRDNEGIKQCGIKEKIIKQLKTNKNGKESVKKS